MPLKNTREVPVGPAARARAAANAAPTGPAVIAHYLKTLPDSPGVYRMIDAEGTVIYVGKARNLKARVTSYARAGTHSYRIVRMIANTAAMEFVSVRTEAEALLLEANLIKRFRPRYNVLLRDDKSFPFILLASEHRAPQILKHRGARNRKGEYFGPFASAGAVNRTINMLERAFLLRSCSDPVFESRTRPCLLHQIKRCSAPCTGEIGLDEYNGLVGEAVRFLRGREPERARNVSAPDAGSGRPARLRAGRQIPQSPVGPGPRHRRPGHQSRGRRGSRRVRRPPGRRADVRSGVLLPLRSELGQPRLLPQGRPHICHRRGAGRLSPSSTTTSPCRASFCCHTRYRSRQLLADALSTKAERRVEIRVPQRGTKTGVVEHALQNAREALGRKLAESSSQLTLLKGLQERFELPAIPRRIEVFDNSHTQGSNAVGAMIVAGASGFVKNQYRKFNIKAADLTPGDDYAMMREVLTRRFKRLVLDEAEAPVSRPSPGRSEASRRRAALRSGSDGGSDSLMRFRIASAQAPRLPG